MKAGDEKVRGPLWEIINLFLNSGTFLEKALYPLIAGLSQEGHGSKRHVSGRTAFRVLFTSAKESGLKWSKMGP